MYTALVIKNKVREAFGWISDRTVLVEENQIDILCGVTFRYHVKRF